MRSITTVCFLAAGLATACSHVDGTNGRAAFSDSGTRINKSSIRLTADSGVTITMNYAIEYHNHSSNKPFELWNIAPLEFQVAGVKPDSQVRVVFTNFSNWRDLCVTRRTQQKRTTYFVDLKPQNGLMMGNLVEEGFLLGDDGKSYSSDVFLPFTKRAPYCEEEQSTKQLVAVVVDGVWQTARSIERNGVRTDMAGDLHDFELHLESY